MTRYEQGFMNKCAEYGVDGRVFFEKQSDDNGGSVVGPAIGAAAGSAVGGAAASVPALAALWNEEFPIEKILRDSRRGRVNTGVLKSIVNKYGFKYPRSGKLSKKIVEAISEAQRRGARGRKGLAAAILGLGLAGGGVAGGMLGRLASRGAETE